MSNIFSANFIIDYQNINEDLTSSFTRMMGYLQETSLLHTKYAGYPMEWFPENNRAFILTSWNITINSYPKWNDEIKISTWPSFFKGILAKRSFKVTDINNNPLILADSDWMYMDTLKSKPVKIDDSVIHSYGSIYPSTLPLADPLSEDTTGFSLIGSYDLLVKRSDIDSNHHVNNISYVKWAIDSIPDKTYDNFSLENIKIKYKKESKLNDLISVYTYLDNNNQNLFLSIVKNKNDGNIHSIIKSDFS